MSRTLEREPAYRNEYADEANTKQSFEKVREQIEHLHKKVAGVSVVFAFATLVVLVIAVL